MAGSRIETILERDINSLKDLRDAIKSLQNEIATVEPGTEKWVKTSEQLYAAQEQLTSVMRASREESKAAEGSIAAMEKEYRNLYNTYKLMSEEWRNSAEGMAKAAELKGLSEKLNEAKKNVGNFKDNIGHYSEGVIEAFSKMGISLGSLQGPMNTLIALVGNGSRSLQSGLASIATNLEGMSQSMGKTMQGVGDNIKASIDSIGTSLSALGGPAKIATTALKGVGSALKALVMNPVGITIMAIVAAFKALQAISKRVKDAINANEESQMKLKEAMAAFQPVIDAVSNAFDKLGTIVVKVIGFVGDAFAKIREIGGAVTDFLGITKGANKRIKEQNELYKSLAQSQNELTKQKREYQALNAQDEAEVQRLREEASEVTNLEEKRRLLTEAKNKQAEIDARAIAVAQEELRILQEQSKLTANDAAMNDKLAAALANVSKAQADAANNARAFNKQMGLSVSSGSGAGSALKNWREEAKKIYEETVENNKTEIQKTEEKYKKEYALLKKYHLDTTLLTKQYNKDMERLRKEDSEKERQKVLTAITNVREYNDWIRQFNKENELYIEVRGLEKTRDDFGKFADELTNVSQKLKGMKDSDIEAFFQDWADRVEAATGIVMKFPPKMDEMPMSARVKEFYSKVDAMKEKIKASIKEAEKNAEDNKIVENLNKTLSNANEENLRDWLSRPMAETMNEFYVREAEEQRAMLELEADTIQKELIDFKGTNEQKIEMWQRYYEVVAEMREADWAAEQLTQERREAIFESQFELFDTMTSSINNVIGSYASLIEQERSSGNISKAEAEKKKNALITLEKITLAVNAAQVAASTVASVQDIWRGYTLELVNNAQTAAATGPAAAATKATLDAKSLIAAGVRTASVIAAGAANVAAAAMGSIQKIRSLKDSGSDEGGATAAVAAPREIDSNPYTYTRTLQTTEEEDAVNRPIYVSVTDINDMQNKVKVVENESSF